MTVHMIKLSVGSGSVENLAAWQKKHRTKHFPSLKRRCAYHTTRQRPKRQDELLAGGSIYWVIKGVIQVRQKLLGFETMKKSDGVPSCALLLDPELIVVEPQPRRAFQGWRYLDVDDAPGDLDASGVTRFGDMPLALRQELAALCLL